MKKYFLLLTSLMLILSACDKENTVESKLVDTPSAAAPEKKVIIDSVSVNDSLKINDKLSLLFKSTLITFPNLNSKSLLDSIYAPEEINSERYTKAAVMEALQQKKNTYFADQQKSLADIEMHASQQWTSNSAMSLFSNQNDYLTVKYYGDGYTGGAHGYYYENYKVFDLRRNKSVLLTDVIKEEDSQIWNRILMDNFLKNDTDNGQAEMLLVKTIPLNNNFYFDHSYLYFFYNQYEITAYAAGPVLIKVPLKDIKPFLKADFKKRMDL